MNKVHAVLGLNDELLAALFRNSERQKTEKNFNPHPVVKFFTPDAGATWLITELDPEDQDTAFGLSDVGQGMPELCYVSLSELATHRGRLGLPVERDLYFNPDNGILEYAELANKSGRIVT